MLENNFSGVYYHKYMKIKTNSNDRLPLEKALGMLNIVVLIKSIFSENYNQYYHQTFLEKYSYKLTKEILYESNVIIELVFLRILMLIRQVGQRSVSLNVIGIL